MAKFSARIGSVPAELLFLGAAVSDLEVLQSNSITHLSNCQVAN